MLLIRIRVILGSWILILIRIKVESRIRIRIKVKSRIRIRINMMRIRNIVPDIVGCSGSDGSASFLASETGTGTPFLIKMRRMGEQGGVGG